MLKLKCKVLSAAALLAVMIWSSVLHAESKRIRIGVIVPLTGSLAVIGTATKNGIELARKEHSSITSHLNFLYEDTHSQTKNAISAYRNLVGKRSVKMIFAFNSANAHALGPLAERAKLPFVSFAFESAPARGKNFLLRPFSPSEHYILVLLKHLRAHAADKNSYFVVTTQFSFLRSMLDAFENNLNAAEKLTVLANVPPGETDFRAVLTRLRSLRPERVGVFLLPHQIASFLKQANESGLSFETYGTDFFESAVPLMANRKLLQGAAYPDNFPSEVFRIKYRKHFGNEDQLTFAAAAYEMTLLTARLLNKDIDYSGEKILETFKKSDPVLESVMGPFRFVSEQRHGQYFRFPIVIKAIDGDHGAKIADYE